MPGAFRAAVNKAIPWLLFGSVMLPALLSAIAGILVLAFWRRGGDIALGILVIAMAVAVIAGSFVSLGLLLRQNRMAHAQAEFIAHVSHELRTPMASIRMGIETLREGRFETDGERRLFLDMLDRESRRLAALVEQAIGYQVAVGHRAAAKAAGDRVERASPACASRMVRDIAAGYLARPDGGRCVDLRVEHDPDDDVPCGDLIAVDPDGFAGAVCNLINNALTHGGCGPQSPVEVSLRTCAPDEIPAEASLEAPDGAVIVEVADHGPGIREADLKVVFEKFRRGSGAAEAGFPGFGLGLSIVREFALEHGGTVTVDSRPGEGCAFRIFLPRQTGGKFV